MIRLLWKRLLLTNKFEFYDLLARGVSQLIYINVSKSHSHSEYYMPSVKLIFTLSFCILTLSLFMLSASQGMATPIIQFPKPEIWETFYHSSLSTWRWNLSMWPGHLHPSSLSSVAQSLQSFRQRLSFNIHHFFLNFCNRLLPSFHNFSHNPFSLIFPCTVFLNEVFFLNAKNKPLSCSNKFIPSMTFRIKPDSSPEYTGSYVSFLRSLIFHLSWIHTFSLSSLELKHSCFSFWIRLLLSENLDNSTFLKDWTK